MFAPVTDDIYLEELFTIFVFTDVCKVALGAFMARPRRLV